MPIEKILIVDDETLTREFLKETLSRHAYEVATATNATEAIAKIKGEGDFDAVITDMKMDTPTDGMQVLHATREVSPQAIVIVMTAFATVETAVQAMRDGAYDYLTKPFSPDQIEVVLARAVERQSLIAENRFLKQELKEQNAPDAFVGESECVQGILNRVKKVAPTRAAVMIQGESGTGKELIANAIHYNSPRADKPFVRVNCAALSESLLESELFGHEKGAFTGAVERRQGRFELANGGTLLLDEISEISPQLQAKLLRVLEAEEFERVGGTKTLHVDVRIVSTTNRDITQEIKAGNFREDLYFRLNVVPVKVPPLRERLDDVARLVEHFMQHFVDEMGIEGMTIDGDAMTLLQDHSWPGNVRELRNVVHRAMVLASGTEILSEHIEPDLDVAPDHSVEGDPGLTPGRSLDECERELILKTLEETHGNKTAAAKILQVTPRTLRNKLQRYAAEATV